MFYELEADLSCSCRRDPRGGVAPRLGGTVQAAPPATGTRYQLQGVMVDESDGRGGTQPIHEAFLVDTEAGRVWSFQGLEWHERADGKSDIMALPTFVPAGIGPNDPSLLKPAPRERR
jgi:hypothetical protein